VVIIYKLIIYLTLLFIYFVLENGFFYLINVITIELLSFDGFEVL
jgi:hypothetical protein